MMRCQRHETTYSIQSYRKQFRVPKHNQHKRSELVPCQFSTQSIRCFQRRKKRKTEEQKKKKKKKQTKGRDCQHHVATMYFSQPPKPKPFRVHFLNVCLQTSHGY